MALLDDINERLRDFVGWDASNPLPIGDPRTGVYIPSKADFRELLLLIAQTLGDPEALDTINNVLATKAEMAFAGKMFGQRSSAVTLGQARLPENLGLIATREGDYMAIRAPLVTADDPLFGTAPQWGVITRLPTSTLLDAAGISEPLGVSPTVNLGSTIPDRQWVAERVITKAGSLYQIEVFARIAGQMEIAAFSESGGNLVKGERRTVFLSAGHNRIILDSEIPVAVGQRVGWWATPGLVSATDGLDGQMGGYHRNGDATPGKQNTVTFGTPFSANLRFSVAFAIRRGGNSGALGLAIEAFKAAQQTGGGSADPAWSETSSHVLVWAVGQSNGAGRGTSPSAFNIEPGRAFKYDPEDGIVHLIEPTGTDSLAQTNNYTSFGSGIAAGVLGATAGRVGVIVVNSCVGATTIADWAAGATAWTNAQAQIAAALTGIEAAKLNVIGAVSVFCQGEGDAFSTPAATYKAGVTDLLSRMRAEIGLSRLKMMIVQTGTNADSGDTAGFQLIRQAQTQLANDSDGGIIMAHAGARYFPDRGLMVDNLHYTTQGYDEIGCALGAAAAAHGIGLRVPALD